MIKKLIAIILSLFSLLSSITAGNRADVSLLDRIFHRNSVEVYENIVYGDGELNSIDIYVPSQATRRSENACILFIHGGGWQYGYGSKDDVAYLCERFSKKGYVTATMDYTLYEESKADQLLIDIMLDDISAAVSCIKGFSDEHGLNVTKLATSGYSAGGHLSLMYSLTRGSEGAIPVVFTANMSAPVDTGYDVWGDQSVYWTKVLFGSALTDEYIAQGRFDEAVRYVSPLYYVDENAVPSIFLHGMKDTTVPFAGAQKIKDAFEAAGVDYSFFAMPNSNHDLGDDPSIANAFFDCFYDYCKEYFGY